jgi:hypothetical protein
MQGYYPAFQHQFPDLGNFWDSAGGVDVADAHIELRGNIIANSIDKDYHRHIPGWGVG